MTGEEELQPVHEQEEKKRKKKRQRDDEADELATLTRAQKIRRFIIGHTPEYISYSRRQKFMHIIARVFAAGFAFACGLGTAGGAMLAFAPPWGAIFAPLFFIATTFINWKLSRRDVSSVFIRIFGKGVPFKYLFKSGQTDNILMHSTAPAKAKIALAAGFIFCLICGIANAGMNYGFIMKGVALLGPFSFLASPWIVAPVLVMLAITVTLLFSTGYANLALKKNKFQRLKLLVKNMVKPDHDYYTRYLRGELEETDRPPLIFKFYEKFKLTTKTEIQVMGIAISVFSVLAMGLVTIGMFLQAFAAQVGLQELLNNAGGVALSMTAAMAAFVGQLPFFVLKAYATAQTMLTPFASLIKSSKDLAYRFVFGNEFQAEAKHASGLKKAGARLLGIAMAVVPVVYGVAKLASNLYQRHKVKKGDIEAPPKVDDGVSLGRKIYNGLYQGLRSFNALANGMFSWLGGQENGSSLAINILGTTGGTLGSFSAAEQPGPSAKPRLDFAGREVIPGTRNVESTYGDADTILSQLGHHNSSARRAAQAAPATEGTALLGGGSSGLHTAHGGAQQTPANDPANPVLGGTNTYANGVNY